MRAGAPTTGRQPASPWGCPAGARPAASSGRTSPSWRRGPGTSAPRRRSSTGCTGRSSTAWPATSSASSAGSARRTAHSRFSATSAVCAAPRHRGARAGREVTDATQAQHREPDLPRTPHVQRPARPDTPPHRTTALRQGRRQARPPAVRLTGPSAGRSRPGQCPHSAETAPELRKLLAATAEHATFTTTRQQRPREILARINADEPLTHGQLDDLRVYYVRWLKVTGCDEPYADPIAAALYAAFRGR